MSLPPQPPADGFYPRDAGAQPAVVWGPPLTPSWAPGWPPPSAPLVPGPPAGPPPRASSARTWVTVLVAVTAFLTGAVGAGFATAVLFTIGAEEVGRGMSDEVTRSMEDTMGWTGEGMAPSGPVEEFPAVAPGHLGPDPVLDAYAAGCFAGDLGACDDLYFQSPPLSDYEEYAGTCGGRVKLFGVTSCTELE